MSAISNSKINTFYLTSDSLASISGFNGITDMQMIRIDNCPSLTSISGFQNLNNINLHFWLRGNNSLSDISGFGNLKQVASQMTINGGLFVDISIFTSLKLVGSSLILQNLPNLNDISILDQLYFIGSIQILNNPLLESCCEVKKLIQGGKTMSVGQIKNNKLNCSSLLEIYDYCIDSDLDGIEDLIDNCPSSSNPLQSDYDGDGVGNGCDNCPLDANIGQSDIDGNGIGDLCDNGQINIGLYNEFGDIYNSNKINGIILKSINGTCFRLITANDGRIETYLVPCP